MIYNPKMKDNRRFKPVALSSARKLFERFGYSLSDSGHPDGTDPFKFSDPSFKNGVLSKDFYNETFVRGVSRAYAEVSKEDSKVEPKEEPKEDSKE